MSYKNVLEDNPEKLKGQSRMANPEKLKEKSIMDNPEKLEHWVLKIIALEIMTTEY
jgi:hypothetical protein